MKVLENTSFYYDLFNRFHLHVSCLGCDQIKQDTMKMICGHNICKQCLNKYSSTEHPRSSIRCDVCMLETKVVMLTISVPNRSICEILIECQVVLGRKFFSGTYRMAEAKEKEALQQA